jgi:hypothetical protein
MSKVSQYTSASAFGAADTIYIVQSGNSRKATATQIKDFCSNLGTAVAGIFTTITGTVITASTSFAGTILDSVSGALTLKGDGTTAQTITGANTVFSGTITPTQTGGIVGTTTNNNAQALSIGEYIESVVAGVSFAASGQFGDATSISLTAGDWDVSLGANITANGATVTATRIGISQTTGNSSVGLVAGSNSFLILPPTGAADNSITIPSYRQSLSGTTTIYAKMLANYTVATPQLSARLSARRVR